MTTGAFAIHICRMRRIYASRRAALIAALKPGDGKLYTIDAAPSASCCCCALALMFPISASRNRLPGAISM